MHHQRQWSFLILIIIVTFWYKWNCTAFILLCNKCWMDCDFSLTLHMILN